MALISVQRVEYATRELVNHLLEFDKNVYGITSDAFLSYSSKGKILRKQTLGQVFKLLKLNPRWVIEDELNFYLQKRNQLVHEFFEKYMTTYSQEQVKTAADFCYNLGKASDQLESFFRGFIFFLSMRHVKDRFHLDDEIKKWENDFEFFIASLKKKSLFD